MENIVEGGNADYALHKNHYIPALGERMRQTWLQLSQQEQESIGQDQQRCRQLMSEKQRYGVLGICLRHADVGHSGLGEGTFSGAGSAERANVA